LGITQTPEERFETVYSHTTIIIFPNRKRGISSTTQIPDKDTDSTSSRIYKKSKILNRICTGLIAACYAKNIMRNHSDIILNFIVYAFT